MYRKNFSIQLQQSATSEGSLLSILATQPLSHSARAAEPATQPLSHSARVAGPATQPLSHSGRVDGPATLTRASEWLSG